MLKACSRCGRIHAAGNQYAQQLQQAAEQTAMSYGNLSEFEEILSDGSDLPF